MNDKLAMGDSRVDLERIHCDEYPEYSKEKKSVVKPRRGDKNYP